MVSDDDPRNMYINSTPGPNTQELNNYLLHISPLKESKNDIIQDAVQKIVSNESINSNTLGKVDEEKLSDENDLFGQNKDLILSSSPTTLSTDELPKGTMDTQIQDYNGKD